MSGSLKAKINGQVVVVGRPGPPGNPGANGTNGADGVDGDDGRGIVSVTRTAGTGAPGTTDTYTITYTDATTSTFTVYNGANGASGSGSGDVTGPASSVDNRVVLFNGTTGKIIKDSGVTLASKQDADADLTAIAALVSAANKLPYATGAGTWALADFTAAGRALVDDADAPAQRATLSAAASIQGGAEKVAALSATTGTATGDLSAASIFTVTPTGNITLAFSNIPATGTSCSLRVIITQGATAFTVTMPTGTKWIGSAAPTQVANKACIIDLQTVNGGTTWFAGAGVEQ